MKNLAKPEISVSNFFFDLVLSGKMCQNMKNTAAALKNLKSRRPLKKFPMSLAVKLHELFIPLRLKK